MNDFLKTSHLSELLEKSEKEPVVIFKFSSECNSSAKLKASFLEYMEKGLLKNPVYLVTVQEQPVLSKSIGEMFQTKHESPQVFIIKNFKLIWTEHHKNITLEKIIKNLQ